MWRGECVINCIVPIVLCGGDGVRLWPFSTALLPKQFVTLPGAERTLLQQTIAMVSEPSLSQPLLITQNKFSALAKDQCDHIGHQDVTLLLEEAQRGTAIAVLLASLYIKKKFGHRAIALVVSVDNDIEDHMQFIESVSYLRNLANQYFIVFGTEAIRPDISYGHIAHGKRITDGLYLVDQFIAKPSIAVAQHMISAGQCLWNSGNFMFNVELLIDAMAKMQPQELRAIERSIEAAVFCEQYVIPCEKYLRDINLGSLDHVVIENVKNLAVHPLTTQWHDLGNTHSLWENRNAIDLSGNYISGQVEIINGANNYIATADIPVTTIGLSDAIVINTGDNILIADSKCKEDFLRLAARKRFVTPTKLNKELCPQKQIVEKPWGYYLDLMSGSGFKIKKLALNPLQRTSLQKHLYRSESLNILQGSADIVFGNDVKHLKAGDSINIAYGMIHRIENNHKEEQLIIIEVQMGEEISESDIVMLEDDYGRIIMGQRKI